MGRLLIATRREFLTQGLGLLGVSAALPNFLIRTALAGPDARKDERILVVIQLSGGHDGLSSVVPFRNDDYARHRTQTRIAPDEVIKINDDLGFHPNLAGFKKLYDAGSLALVQGVGYPNANRSHFKSMDIWHEANNSGRPVSHGWIGRYLDHRFPQEEDPKLAVAIGVDKAPKAIAGAIHRGIALERPESYRFLAESRNPRLATAYRHLNEQGHRQASDTNLDFVTETAQSANESSDEIQKLAARRGSPEGYPVSRLAAALRIVASLIAGGLSTRVYYVVQGGFDTHRDQRGRHDRLMTELGDAVTAFQEDLSRQGNADRVLTMSFSEFGRRVQENASGGTDHGKAGPMFLFGPNVKPGIHGDLPGLAAADLADGDLKHLVDFRSVYATVLERWLACPSQPVLRQTFPLVDCLA